MTDAKLVPRKTALVTGASSGIGLEFAKQLAADGYDVVLVARSAERLREVADGLMRDYPITARVLAADLAQPSGVEQVLQAINANELTIDVLINNAGFGVYGPFSENSVADDLEMIAVNIAALTQLTRLLLPQMLARRQGRILNVASTASFQPGPLMAVYFASKAYVLSFSEALANELSGSGVTVTCFCPGPIQTGFQERARMGESKLVHGRKLEGPERGVRAACRALLRGKTLVMPGFANKLLAFAVRFVPRWLAVSLTRRVLDKKS